MTTALAQLLLLENCAACVPQSAIEIISDTEFVVHADNGDFSFIYENYKLLTKGKER